ncbi:MAG: homoserine kinase [Gammaproteobacteria bacterium]|nr:MAG: homoserine kinase [Gammaproteobacteria bacterium]
MNTANKVAVFAPASIGNVSVGFDILGQAVKPIDGTLLGDIVSIEQSKVNELVVVGRFADKLPSNKEENIVWQCLLLFNEALSKQNIAIGPVKLILDKKMPVGSGLGSSACSVVAALHALSAYYQQRENNAVFSDKVLLKMMGQMEAKISGSLHYDNVAPCFLGGLQLMVTDADIISKTLPSFNDCYYVMAYPGINVSTKAARDVLPQQYSRADLIAYGQNLATFVDACHTGDKAQAFAVLTDVVAEPYRKSLLPKYQQAYDYLSSQGALAVGISGSGPTLFCICQAQHQAEQFSAWLKENYLQMLDGASGINEGFVHVCRVDEQGSTVL